MSANYTAQVYHSQAMDAWTGIATESDGSEVHFDFFKTEEEAQRVIAQFVASQKAKLPSAGHKFEVFVYEVPSSGQWTAVIQTPQGYRDQLPCQPTELEALRAVAKYFTAASITASPDEDNYDWGGAPGGYAEMFCD